MAKALVIVESPAKAKTINKYLGKNYIVMASLGHIKDLPKSDLAVDVENGFQPKYEVIEGKKKLMQELQDAAKKVDNIYLAADPDREGEAICWHLQEELKSKKRAKDAARSSSGSCSTKSPRTRSRRLLKSPLLVNINLVDAQQARRVLDRLVGYKISPLLWDKVRRGLSAGRVQTVAVRVIVEREREIRAFVKQEYWTLDANLAAKKTPVLRRPSVPQAAMRRRKFTIRPTSDALVADLDGAKFIVKSVGTKEKKPQSGRALHHLHAAAGFFAQTPFQREAHHDARAAALRRRRNRRGRRRSASSLICGPIPRASRDDAIAEVRDFIAGKFGPQYLPARPTFINPRKTRRTLTKPFVPPRLCARPKTSRPSSPKTSSSSTA